ncbi:MAG: AAA family ATPase [Methylotenera sp.]
MLSLFQSLSIEVLNTNYEAKYALKRHSVETLLALMSQIANVHAIGVLVIDEIQHLNLKGSGGVEKMLNFFVTLVNVIGLPCWRAFKIDQVCALNFDQANLGCRLLHRCG